MSHSDIGADGKPQLVIPGAERRQAPALQRRADAPLKPAKPQRALDIGLFSDDAKQSELFK